MTDYFIFCNCEICKYAYLANSFPESDLMCAIYNKKCEEVESCPKDIKERENNA